MVVVVVVVGEEGTNPLGFCKPQPVSTVGIGGLTWLSNKVGVPLKVWAPGDTALGCTSTSDAGSDSLLFQGAAIVLCSTKSIHKYQITHSGTHICFLILCSSDLIAIKLCFQERLPLNLRLGECCCNMCRHMHTRGHNESMHYTQRNSQCMCIHPPLFSLLSHCWRAKWAARIVCISSTLSFGTSDSCTCMHTRTQARTHTHTHTHTHREREIHQY